MNAKNDDPERNEGKQQSIETKAKTKKQKQKTSDFFGLQLTKDSHRNNTDTKHNFKTVKEKGKGRVVENLQGL